MSARRAMVGPSPLPIQPITPVRATSVSQGMPSSCSWWAIECGGAIFLEGQFRQLVQVPANFDEFWGEIEGFGEHRGKE